METPAVVSKVKILYPRFFKFTDNTQFIKLHSYNSCTSIRMDNIVWGVGVAKSFDQNNLSNINWLEITVDEYNEAKTKLKTMLKEFKW